MGKLTLKIPEELDDHIDEFLVFSGMEIRDKSHIILYAIEKLVGTHEMPEEFKSVRGIAKNAIRERAKQRCQK
jgi:hypothetical protein